MKRKKKHGFTIVELVIVIAVIAILAAVLIPTFSNIIKKANLSADKQAVREMNMALAEYTAAHNYVKPQDVETVMKILGELGYNSYNWACLTTGYSVYYDKQENQMVLYSAKSASIEYPEGYEGVNVFVAENKTDERFAEYNNNVNKALSIDYSFSSSTASQSGTTLVSTKETDDSAKVISSALSGAEGAKIANTIGIDSVGVYVNASTVNRSSTYDALNPSTSTYAEIAAYHLSNQESIVLENNGELKANTFVVSVNIAENATAQQIKEAQVAAGDFVYSVFVQKNIGMLEEEVAVILPAGSTIDVSSHEWQAAKQFSGYFGTDDPDHPVVIKGLRLTDATSYALTYQLQGSSSRYNITGFIGAIYGDSIVENLVFEDITLDSPGKDYIIAEGQKNRNTVAIIGGIIPDPGDRSAAVNAIVRNIEVKDSCSLTGIASVGGIVGYIGAEQGSADFNGTVLIENCKFAGSVISTDETYASKAGYSPAGGILGFTCRCSNTDADITIKNCTFSGKVSGQGSVGGIVGGIITGKVTIENCSIEGATITTNGTKGNVAKLVGYTQSTLNIDANTLDSVSSGDVYVYVAKATKVNGASVAAKTELKK